MDTVNIYYVKTHFFCLVERAAAGEEIVIARAGKPVAKLLLLEPCADLLCRLLGGMAGQFWMADDFDALLSLDILALFYGEDE